MLTLLLTTLTALAETPAQTPLPGGSGAPPAHPNILVILLDDVGCEALSVYGMGGVQPSTPTIDALAQRGVTFTNHYANPLCAPSRALLQTGRYAFRTGFGPNIFPGYQFDLNQVETCIPELLRDGFAPDPSPYARGVFGKWHLSRYDNKTHPLQSGFEEFRGLIANLVDEGPAYGTNYDHYHWRHVHNGLETVVGTSQGPYTEDTWSGSVTAREAGDWIASRTTPFFAQVDFIPPHLPYQVPPLQLLSVETRQRLVELGMQQIGRPYVAGDKAWEPDLVHPLHPLTVRKLNLKKRVFYRAMIEALDANIGQLLARLGPKDANTMVFVLGDNGTEAGVVDPQRYDPRRAKRTCYQLGVRTPLIVAGPLVANPRRICEAPVGMVDLWRTLRDVAGAREVPGLIPGDIVIDSVSYLPLLQNPHAVPQRRYAFAEVFTPIGNPAVQPMGSLQRMITDGTWKLLRIGACTDRLFRIDQDPLEAVDLLPNATTEELEQYRRLLRELQALINSPG